MFCRISSFLSLCAIVVMSVLQTGCGGSSGYSSPQAVFDAAQNALKEDDFETAAECMTEESQNAIAGGVVFGLTMMKTFGGFGLAFEQDAEKKAKLQKSLDGIDELMKKHGIDEETMKGAEGEDKEVVASLSKIGAKIKDKPAFIKEAVDLMEQMGDESDESPVSTLSKAKLKDVKVDGETASGTVEVKRDGKTETETVDFKLVDGSWKIDLIPAMKEGLKDLPMGGGTDLPKLPTPDFDLNGENGPDIDLDIEGTGPDLDLDIEGTGPDLDLDLNGDGTDVELELEPAVITPEENN